jgi:hypothetical protein
LYTRTKRWYTRTERSFFSEMEHLSCLLLRIYTEKLRRIRLRPIPSFEGFFISGVKNPQMRVVRQFFVPELCIDKLKQMVS